MLTGSESLDGPLLLKMYENVLETTPFMLSELSVSWCAFQKWIPWK